MTYTKYLQTFHWLKTKNKMRKQYPYCYFCKSRKNLQLHHRIYKSKKGKSLLFHEPQYNVLYQVCKHCHQTLHDYFGTNTLSVNNYKIIKHFCRQKMSIKEVLDFLLSVNYNNLKDKSILGKP